MHTTHFTLPNHSSPADSLLNVKSYLALEWRQRFLFPTEFKGDMSQEDKMRYQRGKFVFAHQRFTLRQLSKDNRPIGLPLLLMFLHTKDIWCNMSCFLAWMDEIYPLEQTHIFLNSLDWKVCLEQFTKLFHSFSSHVDFS